MSTCVGPAGWGTWVLGAALWLGGCRPLDAPTATVAGMVPVLMPASAAGVASAPTPSPRPPVGIASRVFTDRARHRELATTIWYPAAAGTVEDDLEWDGIFHGRGAWHAALPARPRRLPLVLLSHGSGGDGTNLAWLAETLASHGYLVAATDHPGDRFGDVSVEGRFAAWRRPGDVSAVLDGLLADATFGPRVDRGRVGAAGHSSGGYTVLALAGLRIDPRGYLRYCALPPPEPDCALFDELDPEGIPDLGAAPRSRRDRRVRAVLALVPAFGPGAVRSSLRGITVPVTIVGLPADELAPFELNARRYQRLIPRARLVTVAEAGHFVFMPTCTFAGRLIASEVCVDRRDGVDRAAVHAEVAAQAVAFFDRSLKVPRRRSARHERPRPAGGGTRARAAATR